MSQLTKIKIKIKMRRNEIIKKEMMFPKLSRKLNKDFSPSFGGI